MLGRDPGGWKANGPGSVHALAEAEIYCVAIRQIHPRTPTARCLRTPACATCGVFHDSRPFPGIALFVPCPNIIQNEGFRTDRQSSIRRSLCLRYRGQGKQLARSHIPKMDALELTTEYIRAGEGTVPCTSGLAGSPSDW